MCFELEAIPVTEWTDEDFDSAFPIKVRNLSHRHWTPVAVVRRATDFLVESQATKVLDIGSGVGKFCILAAAFSKGHFTGVEQRGNLVRFSCKVANRFQIERVKFIHSNINSINFGDFDAFYFFNSFEEIIDLSVKTEENPSYNFTLFKAYTQYIYDQFKAAPLGTKIVTYCTNCQEIPEQYVLLKTGNKGKLKFWQKRH